MNNHDLIGKKIAILVTDGFEQSELQAPRLALDYAGATTHIVSPKKSRVRAWSEKNYGQTFAVDVDLKDANPDDYDGLLLPGGVMNPDKLRTIPEAVAFVHAFFNAGKPVAAICHGPQMLIEAGVASGKTLTSYPSIKTDLVNAGAHWVDSPVVVDQGLVTSRRPADIYQFNQKMINEFASGARHGDHLENEELAENIVGPRFSR